MNRIDTDTSHSSGRPVLFGETRSGRHLLVVFEEIGDETIHPVTAYDVPRRYKL